MLSTGNASITAVCTMQLGNKGTGGCLSLWSCNPKSHFKNMLPSPSQNSALQYLFVHYKEKSLFALLDLLNLGSSLHHFAEQGSLVLQREWCMVSHVLMCYIIHLVLVPMNISSRDKSAGPRRKVMLSCVLLKIIQVRKQRPSREVAHAAFPHLAMGMLLMFPYSSPRAPI